MAGVIKIESFDVDVTSVIQSYTLSNPVNINNAFVRRTTSIDKQSGPTGSTANSAPNICSAGVYLNSSNSMYIRQNTTTSQKVIGEVWRYTGAISGPDEFIVRGRYQVTLYGTTTGTKLTSGIVNRNNCIPFWTGSSVDNTTVNDYDASTVSVYIDASNNIQVQRGSATGNLIVYITVVEFTGSNWSVGHVKSSSHDTTDETNIAMNEDSTGAGGNSFSVGNWENATIIEASLEGDTVETGLSDNLGDWIPGSTVNNASFVNHQDGNARNDGVSYAHILAHPSLIVKRASDTNFTEGNGSYTTASFPVGTSTTRALDELALEWFSDTSGVGTAHARGRLSARITVSTGTIQTWVHRSGNNVRVDYGVIDLSQIDGTIKPIITSLNITNIPIGGGTNIIISGTNFGTNTGLAKLELSDNATYGSGIVVTQTTTSWIDTSIQFNTTLTGLSTDQFLYLWITDSAGNLSSGYAIYYGNPDFKTIVTTLLSTIPDHYWTMDNTLVDDIKAYDLAIRVGSPSFAAYPLMRGSTYSGYLSASGQGWDSPDSNWMNLQTETARTLIMVIRILSTNKSIAAIDEEGGSVNNLMIQLAPGNVLTCQFADTGDDNVHAYSDFKLKNNRTYLVGYQFDYSDGTPKFEQFIDGIIQQDSFGNPLISTNLDAHSGNIAVGTPETNDEVFGTDVAFPNVYPIYLAHKMSFTSKLPITEIREKLVERGAIADVTINGDTEANMQLAIDAYNNTTLLDTMCCMEIGVCTTGNFKLTLTNYNFEDGASIHIRYIGVDTLTLVNDGGNLDPLLCVAPYGGTINVINTIFTTFEGIPDGAEWRLGIVDTQSGKLYTTELAGEESKIGAGNIIYSDEYVSDTNVVLQVITSNNVEFLTYFTLTNTEQTIIIELTPDTND